MAVREKQHCACRTNGILLCLHLFFFFFKIYLFFGCAGSSLLCKGFLYLRGVDLLFAACGLFIAVASLVTEPGFIFMKKFCDSSLYFPFYPSVVGLVEGFKLPRWKHGFVL